MTNGEKIKALFPDMYQVEQSLEVWDSWWNAEYKEPTIRNCFGCKYATDNHNSGTEECHLCMWKNQYTPTTKNDLAQERYQDLIDYFGDKETAKTILEDKKEFKAWLERLRWNVKRVDELARELEQLKETTKNDLGVDAVSRQEVLYLIADNDLSMGQVVRGIHALPSVTPQEPRKGHWIKEESVYGWDGHSYQCSECGRSIHLDTAMESLIDYPYCHCGTKMESEG